MKDEEGAIASLGAAGIGGVGRREARLAAEHGVTRILAGARSIGSCSADLLHAICPGLGADIGELWMADAERLVNVAIASRRPIAAFPELEAATQRLRLQKGQGYPGLVWESGEPLATSHVSGDARFLVGDLGMRLGLGSVMAFPIRHEREVVGVLQFFARTPEQLDADALAMMGKLGSEIGQFVARLRAEDEVERLNAALANRLNELETVLDVAPVGIAVALDAECRDITVNAAGAAILGIHRGANASFAGSEDPGFRIFREGRELKGGELPLRRAAAGDVVENEEVQLETRGGERRHVLVHAAPLFDARGAVRGAVASLDDLTPLRIAEEAARLSRERLDLVVNAAELGLWFCDLPASPPPPGPERISSLLGGLRASAHLARHFGLHEGAAPELADLDARLHPDDRAAVCAAVERAIEAPGPFDLELRTVGLDDRVRWIRAIGAFSADAEGRPIRFDGVTVDVTEQKAIEAALRESARRKDDFLALLGHELRNPLAPIRNSLAILGLPNVTPEAAAKARTMMERQLGHLTRLVDDLLDVSRISRGKIELKRTTFDLAGLVRSTVEDHRPAAETRGLSLSAELAAERLDVHADATRVAQSVGNLLQNALKFTPAGGRISVRLAGRQELAALVVEDTGIGMDGATLQSVFEPFRQADHRRGGLGLGLAVARRLVELNGGTLGATSPGPGKGSRFELTLPLTEMRAAVDAPRAPAPAAGEAASRRRVLIVEDNLDAADSLAAFLQMIGHQVAVAYDGPSGVERALGFAPEVVLCDIDLPGLDGYAVAAALRKEPALRGAYLVAMTGYGQADDKRRAKETGFDAHLTKPTDPAALERLLARLPSASLTVATPSVEKTFF